ncbi:hypothetical protein F750_6513 [Streptomyces sp. PAMC 26508]|nr:hypothetical protein F750_6513 [Streptomyces sp. PAMC 26508]
MPCRVGRRTGRSGATGPCRSGIHGARSAQVGRGGSAVGERRPRGQERGEGQHPVPAARRRWRQRSLSRG